MNRIIAERYQRKKIILEGASKSYSKNGIEGMTMDDIALNSDFGKATIYYYFPSKEDIICSLMEMGWQDLWESVEEVVIEDISSRKLDKKISGVVITNISNQSPLANLLNINEEKVCIFNVHC